MLIYSTVSLLSVHLTKMNDRQNNERCVENVGDLFRHVRKLQNYSSQNLILTNCSCVSLEISKSSAYLLSEVSD